MLFNYCIHRGIFLLRRLSEYRLCCAGRTRLDVVERAALPSGCGSELDDRPPCSNIMFDPRDLSNIVEP